MTGAMDAAISGLQSHMSKLNVIGNNIANVNTNGYKTQRTLFEDTLYTTLYSGSNGSVTSGGTNPSQIGYGVRIGSIDTDMSTGTFYYTGRGLDCMIDGDGFFLVGSKDIQYTIDADNPETLKSLTLTRVGNFEFKSDGYLSDGGGSVVYGFLCTGYYTEEEIADAEEGSLPAGVKAGDPKFSDQLVPICYPRMMVDDEGNYQIVFPTEDESGNLVAGTGVDENGNVTTGGDPLPFAALDSINIDPATGRIVGISKDTDEVIVIGYIAIGNVTNPNGVTHMGDSYYKAMDGAGSLTVTLMGGAEKTTGITHIGNGLDDDDNVPYGSRVGSSGSTSLNTGGLEGSKVDLATEIAEMIKTQRGYQANSRILILFLN